VLWLPMLMENITLVFDWGSSDFLIGEASGNLESLCRAQPEGPLWFLIRPI